MKKYSSLFITLLILIIFSSCGDEKTDKSKTVFIGKYFPSYSKVYLNKVHANNVKEIDSADISGNPEFIFRVNSPDYALYRFECEGLYPLIVVAKNGDTIRIEQTADVAWPYLVQGNDESMLTATYLEKLKRDEHKVDSLSAIFHSSQSEPDFLAIRDQLNREFKNIHESHKEWARKFVSHQPGTFASLIMINSFFREFLLFDTQKDFTYYELVAEAMKERFPENKYTKDLNEQVDNIRKANEYEAAAQMRLSPGRMVPHFEMRTIDGAMTGPQDFEGKNLLIYFWSASDAKSRQANQLIKEINKVSYQLGLEILTISFDRDPNVWTSAIELDELPGIHISDAAGPGSPLQKLFNLKMQLPAYFLIDTKGRIFTHGRDFNKLPPSIQELITKGPNY